MPSYSNAALLEQRISRCYSELIKLLQYEDIDYLLKIKIRQINAFYQQAFNKTSDEEEGLSIVEQYEQFIITASEVRSGLITAEQAYEKIEEKIEEEQINVLIDNILKVCELLFWVSVAAISYAICLSVGLPLLFLEPLIGCAVSTGTSVLFLISVVSAANCFEEFKTFDPINNQYAREKDLLSFFSTNEPKIKSSEELAPCSEEEVNSTPELGYCL